MLYVESAIIFSIDIKECLSLTDKEVICDFRLFSVAPSSQASRIDVEADREV